MTQKNDQAKFAFFYMLSLVALLFTAIGFGRIIFEIINQYISDPLNTYRGFYNDQAMKFSISSLIIAVPIYYYATRQILKNLFQGKLDPDSGIRKWLTYFILFVTSVVSIGWLIAVLNNFLDGELTLKFILKALTAVGVSAIVFAYYFYDIKRKEVENKKDSVIKIFFYTTLILLIAALVAGFLTADSPIEARDRRLDDRIIEKFSQIESANYEYHYKYNGLADTLDEILESSSFLKDEDIRHPISKERFEYNKKSESKFELCAEFRTSNLDMGGKYFYYDKSRLHDKGYQCLQFEYLRSEKEGLVPLIR